MPNDARRCGIPVTVARLLWCIPPGTRRWLAYTPGLRAVVVVRTTSAPIERRCADVVQGRSPPISSRVAARSRTAQPLAALHEHLAQQVGPVGHQAVDAEVEQLVHVVGVVDGPHVDVQPERVGPAEQAAGHHR